jgi:SAM-dependent methyltransferase
MNSLSDEQAIKEFYSKIKFPGPYTLADLEFYDEGIYNPYLAILDDAVNGSKSVLDIGCGSGFITNLLARRHPKTVFTAIDFSDSIDYAKNFTRKYRTKNIIYYKQDFLTWDSTHIYDLVICNGVLHHVPKYEEALKKIKNLSSNKIVIGVYNPYGKLMKKFSTVDYKNEILYLDQEECPFEMTFSNNQMMNMFDEYNCLKIHPSINNNLVNLCNIFNYSNGGLTLYVWEKENQNGA